MELAVPEDAGLRDQQMLEYGTIIKARPEPSEVIHFQLSRAFISEV